MGSMPHSGMPGPPCGPALRSTRTMIGRDVEVLVVDGLLQARIVVEDQRRAGVLQEALVHGGRFDDAAVGREIAVQHRERALAVDRVGGRADDVGIVDLGARDVLAQRAAGTVRQSRSRCSRISFISARMPPA